MKEPKDLGVKIGSKKQVILEDAKTKLEDSILRAEIAARLEEVTLKEMEKMIKEEIENFK